MDICPRVLAARAIQSSRVVIATRPRWRARDWAKWTAIAVAATPVLAVSFAVGFWLTASILTGKWGGGPL